MKGTEERLMRALEELMADKPLDSIRAVEIADRARVSKQTFYNHYEDKYALMDALFRRKLEHPYQQMLDLEPYRECALSFYRTCRAHGPFLRNAFFSKDVNNLFGAMQRLLRESFALRFERQKIPMTREIQFTIDFYAKGMTGFTQRWIERGMEFSDEEAASLACSCIPVLLAQYVK